MSAIAGAPRAPHVLPREAPRPPRMIGIALIVLVVSLIPYLCGYLLSPPRRVFLGALNNIGDLSQYLAAIRQGSSGAWRYTDQFTPDRARPLLMYLPYTLAGHLSLGLSPAAMFQILRLGCAALLLTALARFCRLFVGAHTLRIVWLFTLFAGGLYWIALVLSPLGLHLVDPASLTAPELCPLITVLISPHESLGLAAELLGFTALLQANGAAEPLWSEERVSRGPQRSRRCALAAAGWFLVLALSYPFLLPTVGLVCLAFALVDARFARLTRPAAAAPRRQMQARGVFVTDLRLLALALAPAMVIGLYYARVFHSDPLWSRSGLTAVGRPDIGVLLFGFGPLAIGGWLGARRLMALRRDYGSGVPLAWAAFPLIWAAVNAGTLLLPIWQQGRQALGLTVPLALLSFLAFAGPRAVVYGGRVALPALPAAALAFSSSLLVALYTAVTAAGINPNYYAPQEVMQGIQWLGQHAGSDDVVLASAGFGNLVPEACACRVVIGQNFQSFDWAARQREIYRFYAAPTRNAARAAFRAIVRRERVTLYVVSPYERAIGRIVSGALPGFRLRYRNHDTSIFGRIAGPS